MFRYHLNSGKYLIKIKGVLTGSASFWIGFGKLGSLDPLDTVHKVPGLIGYENTWKYFSSATEFEHETIVHISNASDRIVSYILKSCGISLTKTSLNFSKEEFLISIFLNPSIDLIYSIAFDSFFGHIEDIVPLIPS